MKGKNLFDTRGILTDKGMDELEKRGKSVSCECPEHLVTLLRSAKEFTDYQEHCLIQEPADEVTHQWLKSTSVNIEHLISNAIVSLARKEGIIDEENNFTDS